MLYHQKATIYPSITMLKHCAYTKIDELSRCVCSFGRRTIYKLRAKPTKNHFIIQNEIPIQVCFFCVRFCMSLYAICVYSSITRIVYKIDYMYRVCVCVCVCRPPNVSLILKINSNKLLIIYWHFAFVVYTICMCASTGCTGPLNIALHLQYIHCTTTRYFAHDYKMSFPFVDCANISSYRYKCNLCVRRVSRKPPQSTFSPSTNFKFIFYQLKISWASRACMYSSIYTLTPLIRCVV